MWDIARQAIIYRHYVDGCEDFEGDSAAFLEAWERDGVCELSSGVARGRFDYCGPGYSSFYQFSGLSLRMVEPYVECEVFNDSTGEVLQALKFESLSGDWASPSFSRDGQTIAILEPYYATFFFERGRLH